MIITIAVPDDEPDPADYVALVAERMREGFDSGYEDEETYWDLELDYDESYRPRMDTINVKDGLL